MHANDKALPDDFRFDDYRLEGILHSDPSGIRYLARDSQMNSRVWVWEYLPDYARRGDDGVQILVDSAQSATFQAGLATVLQQARTLSRPPHPSCTRLLRWFRANGTAYWVGEFEQGETLGEYLAAAKTLDAAAVDRLLDSLLPALQCYHQQGSGLGLRPDLIRLRGRDQAVRLRVVEAALSNPQNAGGDHTGYYPPEYFLPKVRDWSGAADCYVLGTLLYHAITGQPPPSAPERLLTDDRPSVQHCTGYPPVLLASIDRALALKPQARFATAREWIAFLAGDEVAKTPSETMAADDPALEPVTEAAVTTPITLGAVVPEPATREEPTVPIREGDPATEPATGEPTTVPAMADDPATEPATGEPTAEPITLPAVDDDSATEPAIGEATTAPVRDDDPATEPTTETSTTEPMTTESASASSPEPTTELIDRPPAPVSADGDSAPESTPSPVEPDEPTTAVMPSATSLSLDKDTEGSDELTTVVSQNIPAEDSAPGKTAAEDDDEDDEDDLEAGFRLPWGWIVATLLVVMLAGGGYVAAQLFMPSSQRTMAEGDPRYVMLADGRVATQEDISSNDALRTWQQVQSNGMAGNSPSPEALGVDAGRLARDFELTEPPADAGTTAASRNATLERLLAQGEESLQARRLTTPRERSALYFFLQALALDSDNNAALMGIQAIADSYAELANRELGRNQADSARRFIELGLTIVPQHPELQKLQSQLADDSTAVANSSTNQ